MTTTDDLKTADPVRAALADRMAAVEIGRMSYGNDMPKCTKAYFDFTADERDLIVAALRTPAPLHSGEPVAWRSIETAPKDGTKVDLWHPIKGRCVDAFWQRQTSTLYDPSCWSNPWWGRIIGATHWMPLPAAPGTSPPAIELDGGVATAAEIQSGMDRQKWAENLILQLPPEHQGRNSWLLNYGRADFARDLRKQRGLKFNEQSQAINPCAAPKPERAGAREDVDADALWVLASALHSNVPEDKRPMSWSDFSPEQIERLQKAANAFLAALSPVALHDGGER